MSEKQHEADKKSRLRHHGEPGKTDGGRCLNRHLGRSENSCSHQWQAYKRMLDDDSELYNGKEKSFVPGSCAFFTENCQKGESAVTFRRVNQPAPHSWDIGHAKYPDNFKEHCNVPYYHEAHHIIPNSTLRASIETLFKGKVTWFRRGLINEGYNLNHKHNMIMLPMEQKVGVALKLPCHRRIDRKTRSATRSHNAYSKQVEDRLSSILSVDSAAADGHKEPTFSACRKALESLSQELHDRIVDAGSAATLDDMEPLKKSSV